MQRKFTLNIFFAVTISIYCIFISMPTRAQVGAASPSTSLRTGVRRLSPPGGGSYQPKNAPQDLEGKLICGIGISGNYPYIENKIRRYLTIRPSDPYIQKVIGDQMQRTKEFYKREGWIGTEVSVTPEYMPETDSVYVHLKIERGSLLRYKAITVTGNYSLPRSLVASKINTWKPYTPRRLREAVRRITHAYRIRGYPLARVRVTNQQVDLENHTTNITVNIEEGPHVAVAFKGNKHLGGKQLKKIITVFSEGAIDTFELEESAKIIEERYTARGFPNASVKTDRDEISPEKILITFNIDEGTPERIRKITFTGNEQMSSGSIENHMASKSLSLFHPGIFDQKVLYGDLKQIDSFYQSRGFPDAKASAPRLDKLFGDTQLAINIPVEEGPQLIIGNISFEGDLHFREKRLEKVIKSKEDRPLDFTILDEEELDLTAFYADHGYPYAEVSLNIEKHPLEGKVDLRFTVNSGPEVRFGAISIIGDFITSQKAIRKAMTIREGEPFSYEKLVNSKVGLRRLDAFATVDIEMVGLEEKETVIPLVVKVEEMRPFKLDFEVGFSTDEHLIGGINFVNRNTFGWGKHTGLRLTGGQRFSRGEISWTDPRLAGWDLEMSLSSWLQYENKSVFKYVQAGGGVGLFRRYHRTSFLVRTNLTRNYLLTGSSTAADAESLRNNTIFNTLLSMSFDTRNNFADPTKGVYVSGYSNFLDEIRGQNAHFVKLGILGGVYFTFADRFTLANDVRFEGIETFRKNTSIPSNELYLLGGDDSIRGFKRDSIGPVDAAGRPTGGRLRFICNNEFRIGLFGNFKWVFFHDMGFLTNDFTQVSVDALRHSVGFGIYYITPIGPIKADYGFIADRKPGEDMGRFHLTFGYVF